MDVCNNHSFVPSPRWPDVCRYDVFLSFRGKDVRKTFVEFLYQGLIDSGINVFIDHDRIEIGEEIMPKILQVIGHTKICIPIFTKDFASSKSCLEELDKMMECDGEIKPIFCGVTPPVVRYQRESYQQSFCYHEARGVESATLDRWKDALHRVSNILGWELEEFQDGELELIKEVVFTVLGLLNSFGEGSSVDDWHSCSSTFVEDEKSDDEDGVGRTLSANISEPVHNVSPNGSFRISITSWKKSKLLGRGFFGTVYEVVSDDGFIFAIKEVPLPDPESQDKEKPLQEISLLSQLDHENIVRYLGSDKDDKNLYICLELMTKGSLVDLYCKDELSDDQVSKFTRQILNGLKYLHDQTVVHRDIKCANVLVDASGSVKLADFGLAKVTEMSAAKTFLGSAFWMAPEVVNAELRSSQLNISYGSEVDIWSLGCTVLEMLTRQRPYPKLEWQQALFRIGKGELPPIPDSLSQDARDFILRCLQVNPNDRPSAAQLLDHPFVRKPPTSSGFASPRFNNICS